MEEIKRRVRARGERAGGITKERERERESERIETRETRRRTGQDSGGR